MIEYLALKFNFTMNTRLVDSPVKRQPSWQLNGSGTKVALYELCGSWPALTLKMEAESSGNVSEFSGIIGGEAEFEDGRASNPDDELGFWQVAWFALPIMLLVALMIAPFLF